MNKTNRTKIRNKTSKILIRFFCRKFKITSSAVKSFTHEYKDQEKKAVRRVTDRARLEKTPKIDGKRVSWDNQIQKETPMKNVGTCEPELIEIGSDEKTQEITMQEADKQQNKTDFLLQARTPKRRKQGKLVQ